MILIYSIIVLASKQSITEDMVAQSLLRNTYSSIEESAINAAVGPYEEIPLDDIHISSSLQYAGVQRAFRNSTGYTQLAGQLVVENNLSMPVATATENLSCFEIEKEELDPKREELDPKRVPYVIDNSATKFTNTIKPKNTGGRFRLTA